MLRHLPYPPCQLGTQFHHYHHPGANKRRRAFNLRQFPSKMKYTLTIFYRGEDPNNCANFMAKKKETSSASFMRKQNHHQP